VKGLAGLSGQTLSGGSVVITFGGCQVMVIPSRLTSRDQATMITAHVA
jgi:hypothetical protein